jgi:hypothetical protein
MIVFSRLVVVAYFVEVGLLLVVAPWSAFWDRNYFSAAWPALNVLTHCNYVRGAVSGLGLVNLGAGVAELLALFGWRSGATDAGREV